MSRVIFPVLFSFLMSVPVQAQVSFSNPLLIPPALSGSFAEIRSNHFHSGIDLRTNEAEGLPVLAAADGFISRIKVSATGFGKAVYLKHSSGVTTVYAHLHHFNDTLEKLVETEQYLKKSFEVELFPAERSLPVNQGQLIGFSGNTGSSAGPHLHFEIRDTKTEMPFNPLSKLYPMEDTIAPVIRNIMLIDYAPFNEAFYPITRTVIPFNDPEVTPVAPTDTLSFTSLAGIAVEADDRMNGSNAMLGVQKLILKVDGKVAFSFEVERFSFGETRYVNASIDYSQLIEQGKTFILLHHLPGNDFSALSSQKNSGILDGEPSRILQCEVSVIDFHGNSVSQIFHIRKASQKTLPLFPESNRYIAFNKSPMARNDQARIEFPSGRVTYNIHDFDFLTVDSSIAEFSSFVMAGSSSIPLHQSCELSIKTGNLPVSLQPKSVIVKLNDKNERISMGGVFQDGWVKSSIRTFGNFFVTIDTIAPVINPLGITNDLIWQRSIISFKLSDDLSGIDKYEMTVDGKWVPANFDLKTGHLFFVVPAGQTATERNIKVKVTDRKGNRSVFEGRFSF